MCVRECEERSAELRRRVYWMEMAGGAKRQPYVMSEDFSRYLASLRAA